MPELNSRTRAAGPYLQENLNAQAKRQFLSETLMHYAVEDYSLSLLQWPKNILQVKSIIGGLYSNITLYFCDLTLIFVLDIRGFANAINVLYQWMFRALAAAYLTQANVFLLDLATAMLSKLRKAQPQSAYTLTEVIYLSCQCFNLKIKNREEVYNYLCLNMRAKSGLRRSIGLDFLAAQWKYLFRSVIKQHVTRPFLPFDLITVTRISYPLPRKAGETITDFLQACGRQAVDHAQVIASALVMDAFPHDMLGILDLSQEIKIRFKRLASNNKGDYMQKHISYIRSYANISNIYTCLACSYFIIILLIEKWTFSECKNGIQYFKKLNCTEQKRKDVKLQLFNIDKDCSLTPNISLHRNHVCVYYQASEIRARKALLYTKSLLESCRKSQPFSQQLKLSATFLDTTISIQIDGINGNRYNISNYPYPLNKLISNQGLNTPFRSR
ncbi:hypothetical protein GGI35DRAFT_492342 [Trichoderma velutinum]